jgi:hypothetical protein
MTKRDIINKILEDKGLDFNKFAMACDIIPNTLQVAINRGVLTDDLVTKIHDKFNVRKKYLESGEGKIFEKKSTSVRKDDILDTPGEELKKLKIFKDFFDAETDYRLIPKKILDDYKMVPDKIIDIIIKSNENERATLEKNKSLEIEKIEKSKVLEIEEIKKTNSLEKDKLIKDYEALIEDYENRLKELIEQNATLKKEKDELLR